MDTKVMNDVKDLFLNPILICAVVSWAMAQLLKFIFSWASTGRPHAERLIGTGGMPSSHSALVCGATIAAAKVEGFGSSAFAICFILACVVMYDALNLRRQAGEHAKVLNLMIHSEKEPVEELEDVELKEKLGHTIFEVLGGALLGIIVPMVILLIFF